METAVRRAYVKGVCVGAIAAVFLTIIGDWLWGLVT